MHKFYENRFKCFALSLIIMIIGMMFVMFKGVQLDIGFKGGAILKYTYSGNVNLKEVESTVEQTLERNVSLQTVKDIATDENRIVMNMSGNESLSVEQQQRLDTALKNAFPNNNMILSSSNTVEPFIGKRYLTKASKAVTIAFILVVIYVWIRFKSISGLSAGVMALVALLHDCVMVFFSFVIFGIPINELFVAVILTIIGYSVNDTIIIYDRIRENTRLKRNCSLAELVNLSITQSMSRSINTCCTTLSGAIIILIFAYIFKMNSILSFALPISIGLISGCYSTICIAGPLWVMWQKHKQKAKQR